MHNRGTAAWSRSSARRAQDLEQLIVARTQGNPLFIEELTRSLLKSGVLVREGVGYRVTQSLETLEIPTSVQGVLLARVDRLREDLKEMLQVASVLGDAWRWHDSRHTRNYPWGAESCV